MCVFERADVENDMKESYIMKSPFKWILIVVTLALLSGFYLYTAYNYPVSYEGDRVHINGVTYKALKGFSLILVLMCYLIAFYHLVKVYVQYPFKRQRYRTLLNVSLFHFFFSFIAFLSSSFYIFDNWPFMTYLLFTLLNTYVYILQILYSPTKKEIRIRYPSRLTNAEVAQRAAEHINQNYLGSSKDKQQF